MANTSKGRFPSYGLVRGPSHADGGVPASVANGPDVELEGGEYIIPKEAVPDYLPVLQQITQVGRDRQQMQNGNSAIDALIASASMQNGIAQPKSPVYQEGGQVQSRNLKGARLISQDIGRDDDMFTGQVIMAIPADQVGGEGGMRYYLSDPQRSDSMSMLSSKGQFDAMQKMAFAPQDSLPSDLVEGYFDRQNKKSPLGFLKNLIGKEQGGMIQYEDGGEVHSRRMYNQGTGFDKKKSDLDGDGKISEYERKRGMAIAKAMGKMQMGGMVGMQRPMNPAMNFSPMQRMNPRMYQNGGEIDYTATSGLYNRFLAEADSPEIMSMKDILMYRAMQNPETSSAELSDKQSEIGRQFSKDALLTKALLNRVGMEGATESDSLSLVNALSPAGRRLYENIYSKNKRQGGSVDYYQTGGQVQPRKQQEMRNPNVYFGPPDSLAYSVKDLEKQAQENFESFMDSLEYRRSLNPFTGEPMDTDADVKRLLERMKKSKIPPSRQRMPMQEGGQVKASDMGLQNFGEVKSIPSGSVSRPEFEAFMNYAATEEEAAEMEREQMANFMSLLENEKRVRPVKPDTYNTTISEEDGMMIMSQRKVPKLSEAYMSAFGFATPLSKRQGALLQRKMIAPETLNPSVKGLINRVLVQRLGNENN